MPTPNPQRDFALDVVQKLRAAGFESLWAGGCVRDQLLGLEPTDYDVATSAKPDEVRAVFGRRRTLPIGASFGVITVLGPRSAGQIEVATFRSDAAYSDGRHPDSVTFTTARDDAARRDFTINGLFFDPVSNEVVDYVGGREDLERKRIRAIGDPHERLHEDKLRMLRAVRFAATFGFEIEPDTLAAIRQSAAEVTTVSAERIGMEVRRMVTGVNRTRALDLLRATGLLEHVLPELSALEVDAWQKTQHALAGLPNSPTLSLAIAALLHELAEIGTVGVVGRRMRFTNKEIERAIWLLAQLPTTLSASDVPWPRLQRVLVHDGAAELMALHEAIAGADDSALAYCRERLAWPAERLNPPPLVDGAALIACGLAPGPEFSRLLEAVRDAQLDGQIATTEEAISLVDQLSAGGLDAKS